MLARKRTHSRRWGYSLALAGAALGITLLGVLFSVSAKPQLTPPNGEIPPPEAPGSPTPTTRTAVAQTPVETPAPPPIDRSRLLYVGSHALRPNTDVNEIIGSRMSVLDAQTLQSRTSFESDNATFTATFAPDRSRLYLARTDTVTAIDSATQQALWTTPVGGFMYYDTLETSPDGSLLYMPIDMPEIPAGDRANIRLRILDTTTGQILPESIALPGCGGITFFRPTAGNTLYFTCVEKMHRLDTTTQQAEPVPFPTNVSRAVLAPDGRLLYNFVQELQMKLQIIDLEQGAIIHEALIHHQDRALTFAGAHIAFSSDGTTFVVGLMLHDANNQPAPGEFQVFDAQSRSRTSVVRHDQPVNIFAMTMSADGSTIYAAAQTPGVVGRGPYHQLVAFNANTGQIQATQIRDDEDIQQILIIP